MINATQRADKSWLVTVTHGSKTMTLWFVGGTKTEINRAAKRELAKMQAGE